MTARPRTSFVLMLALLASLLELAGPGAEATPLPHAGQVVLFSARGMRQI